MKSSYPCVFLIAICLLLTQISVDAHHATATQFDSSKTVRLKGVVSKLDWANPHVHVFVDVEGERGADEQWDVELASPGGIIVSGLSKDLLKPGTALTIIGYPGKAAVSLNASDGRLSPKRSACATQLTLTDGTTAVFTVGI
jgi:hypothetical protein